MVSSSSSKPLKWFEARILGQGGIEDKIGTIIGRCIPTGVFIRGDKRSADVQREFEVSPPFD